MHPGPGSSGHGRRAGPAGRPDPDTGAPPVRNRRAAAAFLAAAAVVGATACARADADAPPSTATVRDSAGITLVENGAPTETWTVDSLPVVDIGVLDGAPEYQLFRTVAGTRLSDGRIVVANAGTAELRWYDADGRHLVSAGGDGDGPGEFQQLMGLWVLPGDSVLAFDWRQRRGTVFGPDGALARSFTLGSEGGAQFVSPVGIAPGGDFLVQAGVVYTGEGATTGVRRDSYPVLRYDLEGAFIDTVAVVRGTEVYVHAEAGGISVMPLAFGRWAELLTAGPGVVEGDTGAPELLLRTPDGAPTRIVRWTHVARPVTPEDVEAYRARELESFEAQGGPESLRARRREALEEIPHAETFPAFGDLKAGQDGSLWVRDAGAPGERPTGWLAFDAEGHLLARVEMPEGLAVWAVGADWVLGGWQDELDVEHVRVYRLTRGAG